MLTGMRMPLAAFLLLLLNSAGAQHSYLVDWDAVGREAIDHLVELVKIPSVNPPGNETEVAEYVRAALDAEGIDSEFYALDPARANLVARLQGNGTSRCHNNISSPTWQDAGVHSYPTSQCGWTR